MILQHIMKHLPISLLIKLLKNSRSLPSWKNRERDTVFPGGGGACRQANFHMVWFGLVWGFAPGVRGGGLPYKNDDDSRRLS